MHCVHADNAYVQWRDQWTQVQGIRSIKSVRRERTEQRQSEGEYCLFVKKINVTHVILYEYLTGW